MKIDKNMTPKQIDKLMEDLTNLKKVKEDREKIVNELVQKALQNGITIEEIKEAFQNNKRSTNKKIKYKTVINGKEVTYSGRGKKPKWFIDYVNNNGDLEAIKVS